MNNIAKEFGISDGYTKTAIDACESGKDLDIDNSTLTHAKFLILLLLQKATRIKIFSGALDIKCFDTPYIKDAIKSAHERDAKFTVLSLHQTTLPIFDELGIPIQVIDKEKVPIQEKKLLENHFMVCDEKSYRIEEKHPEDNIDLVNATVNFHDPKNGKYLSETFDKLAGYPQVG